MNDRELLELAAKAAGILIDKSKFNGGGLHNDGFDMRGNAVLNWHNGATWNPLTDDGDALRLSVKLSISIAPDADCGLTNADCPFVNAMEPHADDPMAATRRAIVRAAAEIGKAMP